MSNDDLGGAMSDDDYELVEHPHEEATHVDHPRYTSPVSDEETENPALTTDALDNLGPAAELDCRSHLRAPVHTHGSMRSWFGVLVLMAILRLVGAPKHPTACSLPPPQGTMQTKLEWGEGATRLSWRGVRLGLR